jgi:hypothetical protein
MIVPPWHEAASRQNAIARRLAPGQNSSMGRIVILIAAALALLLAVIYLRPAAKSDPCGDTGGRWNYDAGICER